MEMMVQILESSCWNVNLYVHYGGLKDIRGDSDHANVCEF